jgi:hypothetical protein
MVTGQKRDEYELELKAIVQKNFLADRLVWAGNLTLEPEWEREHEEIAPGVVSHEFERELAIEVSTGLSYRAAPRRAAPVARCGGPISQCLSRLDARIASRELRRPCRPQSPL